MVSSLRLPAWRQAVAFLITAALLWCGAAPMAAQQQQAPPPNTKPTQQAPAEAGGPQGDIGPMAIPKKKEEPPPPPPTRPKTPADMPNYSLKVDVPLVTVPVSVVTKDGQFIPGLKKENFKVMEDGVPQQITNFTVSEAPITAVLLVEFAATNYSFMVDALNASYSFVNFLKPNDWVAVISYDLKPYILTDFTQDKQQIYGALNRLRIPGFRETNEFDALYDTLDRLERIQGHKYVVLVSSGIDTFSKLTYDKILKKVKETKDVTIFTISTGEALRVWIEGNPSFGAQMASMSYLQGDNEMRTFASLTGGRWYHPRFEAEFPEIFRDIAADIRNQYMIAYHPSNTKLDGTYRKLKVQLIAPDGEPLKVKNEKGKMLKYDIIAREGYTAKHEVE
ncbi:MAG TPA: VWA domain-containing protein [Terriglobales bacterium]|nr:VWA domain-containing protein [Terriglobales bacterium]